MSARRFLAALVSSLALVLLSTSTSAYAAAPPRAKIVFHLQDSRIDEASGIGVGVRSKGIDYVENDSGDTNRFFALNAHTGATAAVITVPHATNVDWEDLQVAPDAKGRSSVWLADIGDNGADRSEIDVYRVPEPRIDPGDVDVALRSARPAIWRLRYPSGPTDAESLAVSPQGRAYLVTKSFLGVSAVYALPRRPDAGRVRRLSRVGTIHFTAVPGRSPVGSAGSVLATSAAISRNGLLLVVRTYISAYVWRLHPGADAVAAALRTTPTQVALPSQGQGEGIAFAKRRMLIDSEGVGSAVWSVPLPESLRSVASAAVPGSASPTSTSGSRTATSGAGASESPSPSRSEPARTGLHSGGLSILILVALFGGVVVLGRRARRFGGDRRG